MSRGHQAVVRKGSKRRLHKEVLCSEGRSCHSALPLTLTAIPSHPPVPHPASKELSGRFWCRCVHRPTECPHAPELPTRRPSPHEMRAFFCCMAWRAILLGPYIYLLPEMATHSSILAWRTPWTEEPGGLQSMRLLAAWCPLPAARLVLGR